MAGTHSAFRDVPIYLSEGGQELHIGGPAPGPAGNGAAVVIGANSTPVGYVATITPAASTSNICLVTIQFQDGLGNNLGVPVVFDLWLSDAASGAGLTATTASGAVAAGSAGTDLDAMVAKKAIHALTDATGKYVLSITDTGKTGFFVAVAGGFNNTIVSAQLVTGNYG